MVTLTAVVVEQKSFPRNLLIGYDTLRGESMTIIPAKEGVKISYKFLPFVKTRSQDFVATVSQHRTTVVNVSNVAERYLNNSSPIIHEKHIPTNYHKKNETPPTTDLNKQNALAEVMKFFSRFVTVSTLLQAQSICKVRVSLK